ncbi:MAG: HPr(Ser) kinase/phosphatase [Deltaproteobacteria bacterium]
MQTTRVDTALRVRELISSWGKELELETIEGEECFDRKQVRSNRVQKPGLRMIASSIELDEGKIQVLGRTEVAYLQRLADSDRARVSSGLCSHDVPCFIISKGIHPPESLRIACRTGGIPLFATNLYTGRLISSLNSILEERLASFVSLHGVLMDIHRVGVLILGKSGIGKSECALDLILRGSKLIADDLVQVKKIGASKLVGCGHRNIKHLMEIRGVGIINIKDLFGAASVMEKREVEMVIELAQWDPQADYDRVGLDRKTYPIMAIELPYLVIPVSPGRNAATIVEVAVRNYILNQSGINTAEIFESGLAASSLKPREGR